MRKLLTVDEFRSAKDGERLDATIMRVAAADPEDAGDRKLRFVFSDGSVDRMGDSINPDGWDTADPSWPTRWRCGPMTARRRRSAAPPMSGRRRQADGRHRVHAGRYLGLRGFDLPHGQGRLHQGRQRRFHSAGMEVRPGQQASFGIDFLKQELLEISVCPVPCNPNALAGGQVAGHRHRSAARMGLEAARRRRPSAGAAQPARGDFPPGQDAAYRAAEVSGEVRSPGLEGWRGH
jgi:hypothetical protein